MQELSTNKQKQKDTTSPDVTIGESSRTPAVMETLAKSRDQEVAARQQEELHGINPLEGGTDSNKFLDKVSKREQRPPWLKPWDHVSWDNITNKEKVGRKDTINLFAEEVQKCIDNMQNNATTDQVKIGTDYTVEQFKDRVTTYREKLAQYKSGAIDATTSDERLIYYNMLAMISNLTRRLEWKLKKASKDESRIPESIRKKAYKQFKESFKSETPDYNAFFTIREAADEEIARTAKFNFLGDISIRDLKQRTKKYYNGIELFNEDAEALGNTIMDGSYSKLEPDQRKKRIEKFVQQSEDVFKYAEELRAQSSSPKAAKQLQEIGTPSRSEVHRTLPRVGTLSEYNVHFKDIEEKHITDALRVLRRGYDTARGNTKCTSLMKFVLKHSKTMSLYGQALKEMEDFYSLWRDEKKELASQKWKQWEQRSQGDLRDADIAALATNAIGEYTLARGKRHEVPQDLSLDMSKIHPLEHLMKWYNERAPHHWDRIVQLPPYNGEFEGFKCDEALKRFYSRLDTHTQNLIKDANIFRAVKPQALYDLLENRIEKLPTTMVNSIQYLLKNQALYSSSEAPIHAYMCDRNDGIMPTEGKTITLDRFGSVTIRFKKDHIIHRSTVTFDDTNMFYWYKDNEITVVPMPIDQANRKVWPLTKRYMTPQTKLPNGLSPKARANFSWQTFLRWNIDRAEHSQNQDPLAVHSVNDLDSYAEVQIWGREGLKIGDIEKVYLPSPDSLEKKEKEILSKIPKLLDDCELPWEYLNE